MMGKRRDVDARQYEPAHSRTPLVWLQCSVSSLEQLEHQEASRYVSDCLASCDDLEYAR